MLHSQSTLPAEPTKGCMTCTADESRCLQGVCEPLYERCGGHHQLRSLGHGQVAHLCRYAWHLDRVWVQTLRLDLQSKAALPFSIP